MPMPKKSDVERLGSVSTIRSNAADMNAWISAASRSGDRFSEWARTWLNWVVANEAWLRDNNLWRMR